MKKLHWSLLKRVYRLGGRYKVYDRLGKSWLLDNRNWVDQQLIIRRPYEVAQIARCRQLIRENKLQCFFDIGANFGLYSVLLSDEGLQETHAFEPLPRNMHQLGANLFLNGLDSRIKLHECALNDRAGRMDLFIDPNSTGVSTLLPVESRVRQNAYKDSIQIESSVFDEMLSYEGLRALVKMDVEGAELMALSGMTRFLSRNQVALQVETTPQTQEPVDLFMKEHGYRHVGKLESDSYYQNL
jgi:FkbM family methyltransferase